MTKYNFDPQPYIQEISAIILEVESQSKWGKHSLRRILAKHPRDGKGIFSRDQLVQGYKHLLKQDDQIENPQVMERIKMKPTRTISGVAPVTVLTKPFPCPGKCIFCPNDVRMPKSYLADEPGAQRAERNHFDPYLQTYNRLQALENIGHNTDKVELIVLGGTWSFYPEAYKIWFIKRCFEAMNDFGSNDQRESIENHNLFEEAANVPNQKIDGKRKSYNQIINEVVVNQGEKLVAESEKSSWEELEIQHTLNEVARSRCVGLVIETRPDYIDEQEIIKLRRLGATKIQIGIQSLNDKVMELNKRGHGAKATYKAIELLRMGGFKIHAHWMPNLYGSSVEADIRDFEKLWDKKVSPDELKIYPTSIIANTELYDKFKQDKYKPYSYEELLQVLSTVMPMVPRFCRVTRVVRDIPSTDIVAGNKLTNFRQIAEADIKKHHQIVQDIRSREIKNQLVNFEDLEIEIINYPSNIGEEIFLSYKTKIDDKIVGFLRLSIPEALIGKEHFIEELQDCAMIREVHVYGKALQISDSTKSGLNEKHAQHIGIGSKLIELAKQYVLDHSNYKRLAVISAIGTRNYYTKHGFELDKMYMIAKLA